MTRAKQLFAVGVLLATIVPRVSLGQAASAATTVDGLEVTAQRDQSATQQAQDRYECHQWALGQTGFDPTQPGGGVPAAQASTKRNDYQRAMTACLVARGYAVQVVPTYTPAPSPPPPVYRPAPYYSVPPRYVPTEPLLTRQPLTGIVTTGIGFPTGDTSNRLDVGVRLGLGVTWFPVPEGPFGLRLEGNYNLFGGHHGYYYNYAYYHGEDLYGADLDLQFNLDHSTWSRWYLVGGFGGYRVTSYRSPYVASGCGPFYCGTVYAGPYYSATTDWHGAWNFGMGWEWAVSPSSALFVEARYQELISSNPHFDYIPITFGFRF